MLGSFIHVNHDSFTLYLRSWRSLTPIGALESALYAILCKAIHVNLNNSSLDMADDHCLLDQRSLTNSHHLRGAVLTLGVKSCSGRLP